jgi:hypothetical protein
VLLVGLGGVRWSDVTATTAPTLWRLAADAGLANTSVRTVASATCPGDGWLTVSAGQRAQQQALPTKAQRAGGAATCGPLPVPTPTGSGATVPGWAGMVAHNKTLSYDAQLGLLGDALAGAGRCATAVGPGAAMALARRDGTVGAYAPQISDEVVAGCPLTVVDAGAVDTFEQPTPQGAAAQDAAAAARQADVRAVDTKVAEAVAALPSGGTLLVVGLADSTRVPHLSVAVARGPDAKGTDYDGRWIDTLSTRRVALVQLTDVAATVLDRLGIDRPAASVGAAWTAGPKRSTGHSAAAIDDLEDADTAAQTVRRMAPAFFTVLVVSQILLYGIAALALRREWGGGARRRKMLSALRTTALAFAAVPVATFLADLVPWRSSGHPLPALLASLGGFVAAITLAAALGPWRRWFIGPVTVVAAVTALALGLDIVSGSRLQLSSLMGYSPLVAGRFFGFGNIPFALFATSALLATSGLAELLVERWSTRAATAAVAVIGLTCVVVDGWPRFGSDFGGVIALVPGFAVLGMLVAGARVSVTRFAVALLAALVAISVIAVLDYQRPPEQRSHLGRFVGQVIHGEALTVIRRKAAANIGTLTNYQLALLVPVAFLFVALVLMRPVQLRAAALQSAYAHAPQLRNGVIAMLVTLVIGFAVNDSGIAIPAVALTVAIPLLLAASVRALELDEGEAGSGSAPPREVPREPARP